MKSLKAIDRGMPKTRYKRTGSFSALPKQPLVNRIGLTLTIFFPISPRLAYLVGAVYGDGSVTPRRLTYFNTDKRWLMCITRELAQLTLSGRPKPQYFSPRHRGCHSIDYCSAAPARVIRGPSKINLEIVSLLTSGRTLLAAFLGGIFDSEGSAGVYANASHRSGSPEIAIANSNLGMLRILQRRLGDLGMKGGISLSREPVRGVIDGRKVEWNKDVYRLRFSGWTSSKKFAEFFLPWTLPEPKERRLRDILEWGRRDLNPRSLAPQAHREGCSR